MQSWNIRRILMDFDFNHSTQTLNDILSLHFVTYISIFPLHFTANQSYTAQVFFRRTYKSLFDRFKCILMKERKNIDPEYTEIHFTKLILKFNNFIFIFHWLFSWRSNEEIVAIKSLKKTKNAIVVQVKNVKMIYVVTALHVN